MHSVACCTCGCRSPIVAEALALPGSPRPARYRGDAVAGNRVPLETLFPGCWGLGAGAAIATLCGAETESAGPGRARAPPAPCGPPAALRSAPLLPPMSARAARPQHVGEFRPSAGSRPRPRRAGEQRRGPPRGQRVPRLGLGAAAPAWRPLPAAGTIEASEDGASGRRDGRYGLLSPPFLLVGHLRGSPRRRRGTGTGPRERGRVPGCAMCAPR